MFREVILGLVCAAVTSWCLAEEAQPLFVAAPGSPVVVTGGPQNLIVWDVNNDKKPDLVVGCAKDQTAVLLGDGKGGFRPAPGSPLKHGGGEMALGDVNGDGMLDLALTEHGSYAVTVLAGDGNSGFRSARGSPFAMKDGQHPHTHGLALTDVNRDGKLDLVTANNDDNDVSVMLGDGKGGFARAPGSPFPVGPGPYPLAVGDVNGDGRPDIVTPNSKPGDRSLTVLLGDGKGGLQAGRRLARRCRGKPVLRRVGGRERGRQGGLGCHSQWGWPGDRASGRREGWVCGRAWVAGGSRVAGDGCRIDGHQPRRQGGFGRDGRRRRAGPAGRRTRLLQGGAGFAVLGWERVVAARCVISPHRAFASKQRAGSRRPRRTKRQTRIPHRHPVLLFCPMSFRTVCSLVRRLLFFKAKLVGF